MDANHFYMLAALGAVIVVLQLFLLLRRTRFETPADLGARLSGLEQGLQGLTQLTARAEAGSERIEQALRQFTETTAAGQQAARKELDEQLTRTLDEARQGRKEQGEAFQGFESRLQQRFVELKAATSDGMEGTRRAVDQKLTETLDEARQGRKEQGEAFQGFEARLQQRLLELQTSTGDALEGNRRAIDLKLAETLDESRLGRKELMESFKTFETTLDQRIEGFGTSLTGRFEALQTGLLSRLDEASKTLLEHLAQAQTDASNGRGELGLTLKTFRTEISDTLTKLSGETTKSREALGESAAALQQLIQGRFEVLTGATRETFEAVKGDITTQLGVMSAAMKDQLETNGGHFRHQFASLQESVAQQLLAMANGSSQASEQLRTTMNERLASIQQDNTAKLEEMRRTVDEKLHATLEQRLGESFKLVSERLEQVQVGLGEMKSLAGSVGDLKRVMTNVRSRGTWGEVQLGAIIESLLTVDQFDRNVKTVPGSNEMVEFAIKLPGKSEDTPVWIPIDSKYPVEHYHRLLTAHDTLDKVAIQQAVTAFESSLRAEAKKISTKYVSPPNTTDFAILFLPTEGLFAEAARAPGLLEALQNDFRVVVAGPTTLSAVLNSLRLGFKTLAIEKRSSEVWGILSKVKTEFTKFGEIVDATQKSIDTAANKFKEIGTRTRVLQKSLREVQELPAPPQALEIAGAAILPFVEDESSETDGATAL